MSTREKVVALRAEGKLGREIAEEVGISENNVWAHLKRDREGVHVGKGHQRGVQCAEVPNEDLRRPVQRAMLENDISWVQLAARCGQMRWTSRDKRRPTAVRRRVGDPVRIKRALGVQSYTKRGQHYTQIALSYDLAVKIAVAAGLDPVDVGL